jgi:four helix bundle protein
MKNFKNLGIWQTGMEIVESTFDLTKELYKDKHYQLGNHIQKTAISIPSNIAEGNGRNTDTDCARFIDIAIGSAFELETQILIVEKVTIGNALHIYPLLDLIEKEQRMLTGFLAKLRKTR